MRTLQFICKVCKDRAERQGSGNEDHGEPDHRDHPRRHAPRRRAPPPVTITYLKEEKDETGRKTGRLIETVRTVELHSYRTTKAGHVILRAADRETGEMRTWRLDRIRAYSIHRTAYLVPVPADEAPAPTVVPATPAALIALELGRDDRPTTTPYAHAA